MGLFGVRRHRNPDDGLLPSLTLYGDRLTVDIRNKKGSHANVHYRHRMAGHFARPFMDSACSRF